MAFFLSTLRVRTLCVRTASRWRAVISEMPIIICLKHFKFFEKLSIINLHNSKESYQKADLSILQAEDLDGHFNLLGLTRKCQQSGNFIQMHFQMHSFKVMTLD